ncbi:MAG: tRNA (N6-isopentenyl adenosine(37)-C2)-methylthiotransferase MiaB [Deltaproteobacteria bacterium]|nr:tRNA (N6-isopentenyl adenosine(37)-C2)-methylthiotransferase MiaB [Deltaproteobacteria bacterium]
MSPKNVFIKTYGCQMNVYDTQRMLKSLSSHYQMTEDIEAADVVLFNTCSVREKAEHKIMSALGELKPLKKKKPYLVVGVGGCVATQNADKLLKKVPHLDLVFGVDQIEDLPQLIHNAKNGQRKSETSFKQEYSFYAVNSLVENVPKLVSSFVSVIQGCEKPCTFCIVPTTRGFEKSRSHQEVIQEARSLVGAGSCEIVLLGQNVNAYRTKEATFEELVASLDFVPRLRYITSHPNDVSDEMIRIHRDQKNLCEHIHMPIQAGSNRTLKRMVRLYSREEYMDKIKKIREEVSTIAITTDIIVGFPGETDQDFEETLSAIEEAQFDHVFAFKYSPRPGTPSKEKFSDDVPENLKNERLQRVFDVSEKMHLAQNQSYVGKKVEVLVEGPSKNNPKKLTGRTRNNKIVNFIGKNLPDGFKIKNNAKSFVNVVIHDVTPHSLNGCY